MEFLWQCRLLLIIYFYTSSHNNPKLCELLLVCDQNFYFLSWLKEGWGIIYFQQKSTTIYFHNFMSYKPRKFCCAIYCRFDLASL